MSASATDVLSQTVQDLWPTAPAIEEPGRTSAGEHVEFLVLPHRRSPRLLVPRAHRTAAARAMWRFSADLTSREVLLRLGVAGVLRAGGSMLFRDRVLVFSSKDSIADYLAGVLGQDVVVSLGIGSERVNRKPVLQVFSPKGVPLAFVKVGHHEVSVADVSHEAGALEALAGRRLPDLDVPRTIHAGWWGEKFVLVMSVLPTSPVPRSRERRIPPSREMRGLAEAFAGEPVAIHESPSWVRQQKVVEGLREAAVARALERSMGVLAEEHHAVRIPIGAWHGDWTPWNMSRVASRIQLWDWERFETGVPVGVDALHFQVQTAIRHAGWTPAGYAQALGSGPGATAQERAIGAAYTVNIACRYARLAETATGAAIRRQRDVVVEVLSRHTSGDRDGGAW